MSHPHLHSSILSHLEVPPHEQEQHDDDQLKDSKEHDDGDERRIDGLPYIPGVEVIEGLDNLGGSVGGGGASSHLHT